MFPSLFCSFCFLLFLKKIDYHAVWIYLVKLTQLYVFNFSTHIIALFYAIIDQNLIYINSIIALDTLKVSNGSKKLPKFYTKWFILSIGYRKNFEVKHKFDRRFHFKPNRILLNSLILLRGCFHCKHRTWQNCETHSNFYHNLHIWYHEILTNLIIFRLQLFF